MMSVHNDAGPLAYVAVERFDVTVQGRAGTFAMQHSANNNGGTPRLDLSWCRVRARARSRASAARARSTSRPTARTRSRSTTRSAELHRVSDEPDADLWEQNAQWWQEGFTDGADPEYEEQILPLAAECLAGAHACPRHRHR